MILSGTLMRFECYVAPPKKTMSTPLRIKKSHIPTGFHPIASGFRNQRLWDARDTSEHESFLLKKGSPAGGTHFTKATLEIETVLLTAGVVTLHFRIENPMVVEAVKLPPLLSWHSTR